MTFPLTMLRTLGECEDVMTKSKVPRAAVTPEDRQWVAQLEDWVEQVDRLMDLVQGKTRLIGNEANEARERLATLKRDLAAEVKKLASMRRRDELRGFGETDYAPAIEQASAYLTIKVNSVPDHAWFSVLYDTHITLTSPLQWLKKGPTRGKSA